MDLKKLAPWNWFKKEQDGEPAVPVRYPARSDRPQPAAPSRSLAPLQQEMERLFDDLLAGLGLRPLRQRNDGPDHMIQGLLRPNLDIATDGRNYRISVEIPGVAKDEVRLEVSDRTLTIAGEKRQEKEEQGHDFYRMERSYGAFQRLLTLPEDADQEAIKATFKQGVLTITIPRRQVAAPAMKSISIH